jgi:RimJ/RimL family protein N-acetyltransferase
MQLNLPSALSDWSSQPALLEGPRISLLPLELHHIDTLVALGNHPEIWTHFPENREDPQERLHHLQTCYEEMQAGRQLAFVIQIQSTGQLAGFTRLFHLNPLHRQLEMGSWLHPHFWQSGINTEAKLLLLTFSFECLQTIRVQFRTDATNVRSQHALEKMGATLEGILRNERIKPCGNYRDCLLYSIIEAEWPAVKQHLQQKQANYQRLQLAS